MDVRRVLVAVGLMSVLVLGVKANAEDKFGYVDMRKVIAETTIGKKAVKELEKEQKTKSEEFQKKDADLKKMAEDLEKKKAVLSDEARLKKQGELQQESLKLREAFLQAQQAMQKKERDVMQPVYEKIQETIQTVAKEQGYGLVFEKNEQVLLYAKKDLDLTDVVVKTLEKGK